MKRIVCATNNPNKLLEISRKLAGLYEIVSLKDIGCHEDIPEDGNTFEENALQKARYVKDHYGLDCFADDSGLEVEALDMQPGIFSARYAGPAKDSEKNIDKLLEELGDEQNRKARFRTVIAVIKDNKEYFFEGTVHGEITKERHGSMGFGYDSVFKPEGYGITFAEMDMEEKNRMSHRSIAIDKLQKFLEQYDGTC